MPSYRYEDTDYWVDKVLPIQLQTKRYVTVDQCREAWGLRGKSAAHARLKELIKRGQAERIQVGNLYHYHIIEVKK